jgi:hypothetical protein
MYLAAGETADWDDHIEKVLGDMCDLESRDQAGVVQVAEK